MCSSCINYTLFMKTLLLSLTMVGLCAAVSAQNVNIPDANFKAALLADPDINLNSDGEIQLTEALFYNDSINVVAANIQDMTGIEAFPNITGLLCEQNKIAELDLSNNLFLITLRCHDNLLTELDISDLSLEGILQCHNNMLTELELGSQPNLRILKCSNNQLTDLDVSGCPNLEELDADHNMLEDLYIVPTAVLTYLSVNNNLLDSLNLSMFTELEGFEADSNELKKLNLANGNNDSMDVPVFRWNPFLYCIQVDDSAYANLHWQVSKDMDAEYSEDCALFGTGIETADAAWFRVFPNPAHGEFMVYSSQPARLVVLNALGQPVIKTNMEETDVIRLNGLSPGMYYVQMSSDRGFLTETLMIIP